MSVELIMVPGLRGGTPEHWQERLTARLGATHLPVGRPQLDLVGRVRDLDDAVRSARGSVLLVAHSAGVITLLHWAARTGTSTTRRVAAALLATPPTLAAELPVQYPRLDALREAGWLPLPDQPLPFPSRLIASDDDPLGPADEVARLARSVGAVLVPAGRVGHANPAAGFGDWPFVEKQIEDLAFVL